jgi:hypothetical protein
MVKVLEKEVRETADLDKKGLPTRSGVYLAKGVWAEWNEPTEIDVYKHPVKGLCCFSEDFGSSGTEGVDDRYDCHVSVQKTGLTFIRRIRSLTTGDTKH